MMKVDQAAMMCSLETRAVFLDNDLVEFCRRLPNGFKLRNGVRQYLLKEVARALLPPSIVCRQKKGFGVPLAKWLMRSADCVLVESLAWRAQRICTTRICRTPCRSSKSSIAVVEHHRSTRPERTHLRPRYR